MDARLSRSTRESRIVVIDCLKEKRASSIKLVFGLSNEEVLCTQRFGNGFGRSTRAEKGAFRSEQILANNTVAARKSWLESLCEARVQADDLSKEQELQNLLQVEDQRWTARIIARVNGKLRSGSVTSVIAPNSEGQWVEHSKKEEIEKTLCEENERQFNEAKDATSLQQPLLDFVGMDAPFLRKQGLRP